ncbi:HlyD family secretion protein [Phyllobacterium trifolii]|uniref:HlyD family secretion protein n=1 Tax=Phyllobacterium trifolii TaxID=300193 RepID=A0A839UAF8_9HYPH|nr:HlyD family secretion protein [Phyllobacterium trifolii]
MRRLHTLSLLPAVLALSTILANNAIAESGASALGNRIQTFWNDVTGKTIPTGISSSNGRVEAEQVLISAKFAGRVSEVLVDEGQTVDAGTVIARMDVSDLEAQLAGAQAQVRRADKAATEAKAAIEQRESELVLARQELERASALREGGFGTTQALDLRRSQLNVAQASRAAAVANLDAAYASTDAASADVARIRSLLEDSVLKAPRRGRVEYKLVQSGEVVAAGAPVVTLLDLSDVYMTIFLPAHAAGRVALGDDARIILDPAPDYVVPATISFIATEAQFTPKTVETTDEREKLMFRVKLRIAPSLLRQYETRVKAGVRGVGYVRTSQKAKWPNNLTVKLPN